VYKRQGRRFSKQIQMMPFGFSLHLRRYVI
jgi:hypothetical protein